MTPDRASPDLESLPAALPAGERVLWQGRPDWRTMARRAFRLPELAIYFGLLLTWYAVSTALSDSTLGEAALAILKMTGVAVTPLVLVCLYAWMTSREALYTITDRRVVMRIGIAMPVTFNLPFSRIETAGLKTWANGHGSISLALLPSERMAYLVMWPHARPWKMARTEPMLRCIPAAETVAQILGRALAAAADMPVQPLATPVAVRSNAAVLA